MNRNKVFRVQFFVQRGIAAGGLDESETVIASTEAAAVKKVQDKISKQQRGKFILVGVREEGAQG